MYCPSTSNDETINFFTTSNEEQKKRWLENNPVGWKKLKSFNVCSKHFLESEIESGKCFWKIEGFPFPQSSVQKGPGEF